MNQIRNAKPEDLEAIVNIYNYAIRSKFETADTEEIKWQERIPWFNDHDPAKFPIFVCVQNEVITGWLSISPYRPGRHALRFTMEISYYVHPDFKRKGIGNKLLEHGIAESKNLQYKTLFAIILEKNEASIELLSKYGFQQWAHLPAVADFDGIECGQVYYGLKIA
ncbi:MAG: N-acetyltransferase family protein [Ginsengibacter sp.]